MKNSHVEYTDNRRTTLFRVIVYVATVILSIVFLYIGNRLTAHDASQVLNSVEGIQPVKAKVQMVVERTEQSQDLGGSTIQNTSIKFVARILGGKQKGMDVMVVQSIDSYVLADYKEVAAGDTVLITENLATPEDHNWMFVEYLRTDTLLIAGAIFCGLLILFGRFKGFNTILSLGFTCLAVFLVFIPSILAGYNIYLSSIIVCMFVIIMTLLIINGPDKKTLVSILGCFSGVLLSGLLTLLMDFFLKLTGYTDEESSFLTLLETPNPINLKAIIFGAIIIGAMGAIMDVAMSIASALYELSQEAANPTFGVILRAGFTIGQDMMGTMANTLVLAYIGGSLSTVLLLIVYTPSILYLLNREMIVVEILQSLIGSLGLLFTIPFSSLLCSIFYSKKSKNVELTVPSEE